MSELLKDDGDFRQFSTGAVRDSQIGKEIYTHTISWIAFRRYAQYMTKMREKYKDGNFKLGLDVNCYEESLTRHLIKYMANKHDGANLEKDTCHLCAMVFNIFGILHEEEMKKMKETEELV